MNIYVCLKQVPDTEASITVKEGTTVNEANIKWIISPYDEYAIEEALKFKEKNSGTTVTALSLGPERVQNALRTALAMGVEKAVHIEAPAGLDPNSTARALASVLKSDPDCAIVFMGKQAIDDDANIVHILTAGYLGVPVATNVSAFSYSDGIVQVEREIDEGAKEKIAMKTPCVVAATKGLNTPRYASVMGIMKAKKIEIRKIKIEELGVPAATSKLLKLAVPPEKPQGKLLQGEPQQVVTQLVQLLREEAKAL